MPKGYPKHLPDRPDIPVARRVHRGAEIHNIHTEFDDWWEKHAPTDIPIATAKHIFADGCMTAASLFLAGHTIHSIQEAVRKYRRTEKARRYRNATTTPQAEK